MKAKALIIIILLLTASIAYAQEETITFGWTLPTSYILNNNCGEEGAIIPPEQLTLIQSQIRYHFGDGNWTYATTAVTQFSITATIGTTITAEVGSFFPPQSVFCWTDPISTTFGFHEVAPCTDVTPSNVY